MGEAMPTPLSVDLAREILPKNVTPTHYDLQFEPHLVDATEFDGSSVIHVEVIEDSTSITLNAIDLKILHTEVISEDGKNIAILDLEFDEAKERITIPLDKVTVLAGAKLRIKQTFKGSLLHPTSAFFRSPVDQPDGSIQWMASTRLEPTDGRRVFPSFDEPALKATFTITLIAEKHYTCLSNMHVASEVQVVSNEKAKKAVTFNRTPLMSTYIVAFAVGDFQYIETNSFRVPIRTYASMDKNIEHGRYVLELAARTLAVFEKIFDMEFPLPKLDLIAIPGGQGAMENWGLVTFGDRYLLVDEKESSAKALRTAASVAVHELAHQWFGNIVTMDFWDGLWLNESFADWAELYAWETLNPGWKMWQSFVIGGYQNALTLDSNKASHPIEMPVSKATEINQIFDSISYDKGCSVLRMIAGFLGIEVFIEGVRYYLKKHTYGNAKTTDLWDALAFKSGRDVRHIMETWTRNMGYPVVTVSESVGSISVTQNRFLQDGSRLPEDDKIVWPLNLALRTKNSVDDDFKLYERTADYAIKSDFILNADRYGLYRVSYTSERLQTLGQSVKDGFLTPEDKIGLVSDTLALALSKFEGQKTSSVLSLLEKFDSEDNFFVWKQIISSLSTINKAWSCESEIIVNALKKFQTHLVGKTLAAKGWNFKKDDDTVETMFKALLFSAGGENPAVQKAAQEMFDAFVAGHIKAINVNIKDSVFATVIKNGGEKEYEAVLNAVKTASSPDQRATCLAALGQTQTPYLLERTLEYAMTPYSVAHNDTISILGALCQHKLGRQMLWDWFKANMPELEKKLGGGLGRFGRLVKLCISSLVTKEQYEDVKSFFADKKTAAYDSYLAQSLDSILAKVNWVERDREDVKTWLEDHGYME